MKNINNSEENAVLYTSSLDLTVSNDLNKELLIYLVFQALYSENDQCRINESDKQERNVRSIMFFCNDYKR